MMVLIRPLETADIGRVRKIDGSFRVEARLVLSLADGVIDYQTAPVEPYIKCYDEEDDLADYIGVSDKAGFLALIDRTPAGVLQLSENWNKYAIIDNIAVDAHFRKAGMGKMLVDQAIEWARARDLAGVMLETQDNNAAACAFYRHCGFTLRGFDTGLYKAIPMTRQETALFWYLTFEP
ncbi:GNAT family N-acetyltransferase [Phyllobacterium myrsinacearum]|uniref:Ribosomal protein S18 acetylase RimI-like enzyme n=1 Tax=Phyllobacterium myrsinacearum TaxID=28101 RepID=A0A839EGK9_9HYPH|nr:GNAT family N-acetyltransferase [Phyllobacterium myrsinacearum]MBA8878022.1 ribosomal protein S18 acetylase RimI-like enzyme [Phyllobacterium myrsinacearum]